MSPTTAGVLQLCIGTVYAGTMVSGSKNLATDHPAFSAADVGRKITVIGAGPDTGDPFTGSLLISTIDTFVDSQHVILHDAAATSCGDGNSNTTVYRPTGANVVNPIHYNQSLTARDTMSFSIVSDDGSNFIVAEGSPVWLSDTSSGLDIFCGSHHSRRAGAAGPGRAV